MSMRHPDLRPHRVHTVRRVGAIALGTFLLVFGVVGLLRAQEFMSVAGTSVFGLMTNGLLATISVVVGLVMLAAGWRGGPAASTVLIVVGLLFLLSGLGNALVISGAMAGMNILAFGLSNVIFSVVVGAALLFVGAYGRLSGGLTDDSPYAEHGERVVLTPIDGDGSVERDMAAAERAVAQHTADAEQVRRVNAAAAHRSHADRRTAFLADD